MVRLRIALAGFFIFTNFLIGFAQVPRYPGSRQEEGNAGDLIR